MSNEIKSEIIMSDIHGNPFINTLYRDENGKLIVRTNSGNTHICRLWVEKKVKKGEPWEKTWIMLPKEGIAETGRTYLAYDEAMKEIEAGSTYEFPCKLEHREGMAHGGWRAKMTPEEAALVAEAEATIERIKAEASARIIEKVDPNSEEGLLAQIAKLQAKLAAKQNAQ